MVVHAAFGGSTNLLLHVPAIAHAAGRRRPTIDDWLDVNRRVPRSWTRCRMDRIRRCACILAGGVPEVMLHLRDLDLLDLDADDRPAVHLGDVLDWWAASRSPQAPCAIACDTRGVAPDEVIMSPSQAAARGLTSTVAFVRGNLAPDGAMVKSTAIDPPLSGPMASIA